MNIRIPRLIEPRLRAHAERLGLSLNATVAHMLGATLPVGEQDTMVEWLDASVPTVDPEVEAAPPSLEIGKLTPLPFFRIVQTYFDIVQRPGVPRINQTSQVWVDESGLDLKLDLPAWTDVIVRGIRVHILSVEKGAAVSISGPTIRRPGGPLSLCKPHTFSQQTTCVACRPVRGRFTDEISIRLSSTGRALVAVEALVELDSETNKWPWQDSPSLDRDRYPLELPIKIPLVFDGGYFAGRLEQGVVLCARTLAVPWGVWRVDGIEISASTRGRRSLRGERTASGRPPVTVSDLRVGGGVNLLASDIGLSWVGFSPGAVPPMLRARPIVLTPNTAEILLGLPHHQPEISEPTAVSGYVLGTLVRCTRLLDREEQGHLAAGRLDLLELPALPG